MLKPMTYYVVWVYTITKPPCTARYSLAFIWTRRTPVPTSTTLRAAKQIYPRKIFEIHIRWIGSSRKLHQMIRSPLKADSTGPVLTVNPLSNNTRLMIELMMKINYRV